MRQDSSEEEPYMLGPLLSGGGKKNHTTSMSSAARIFFEFSFTPQCLQFTLAAHLGTSVVYITFKEKTFSHEHHLSYAWEIFAVHISINKKNE